jgi:hypothetical protein
MDEQPVVTRSRRAVTRDPRAYCAKQASQRDLLPHVSLKLPPRRPLAISSELLIRYRLLPASFSCLSASQANRSVSDVFERKIHYQ